jgi:hypothetical protein
MNRTIRIFGEDVTFAGDDTAGTAVIRYKNRDVVLQFIDGDIDYVVFINGKRFKQEASTITFEFLLPQLIDEVIGVALGVNFCVKRSENFWHYYAEIEQPWQIESNSYPYTVTPSYEHWKRWVIASIEKKGRQR